MMRILVPTLFIVVSLGLFFGYVDPTYMHIKELQAQVAEFDQALDKSRELQAIRDRLLSRYNTFQTEDLDRLEKLLPDTIDNVRLALDLDGIASTYDLQIQDVDVRASDREEGTLGRAAEPYESVVITFSVSASYENMVNLIRDLESSLRIVDVTELSFSEPRGDLYQFSIGLKTYWLR